MKNSAVTTLLADASEAEEQGQYEQAAKLFYEARTAEPQYAADALYYQALAYSKMGGRSNYREALKSLQVQLEQYPDAATRQEAQSLAIRVGNNFGISIRPNMRER